MSNWWPNTTLQNPGVSNPKQEFGFHSVCCKKPLEDLSWENYPNQIQIYIKKRKKA